MRAHLLSILVTIFILSVPYAYAQEEDRTAGAPTEDAKNAYGETYKQLNLFGDVFERVRSQYVEPVEDKELIESAVNGMLTSLDPHSSYLNEDSFEDMQVSTSGEFGGLGIEVTLENGFVKVVSPIDDTPAFRAGLKSGDFITHIDEQPVVGMTLNDAVEKMRGKVGTEIKLTIAREGENEPFDITVTRDVIKIRSVRHEIKGNAGYIRITTFNRNTSEGLDAAIKDIKAKLGENLIGYVLDLRNNPGGLLDQAVAVGDMLLDKGEIVSIRGRHESDTKRDNATPGDLAEALPIVAIINGGSASASEIVAGALQDHKRAIVLGTKSFGKGSVQTVIPIPGHGAIRLTTARYYTPSGRSIQATGIEPDIIVEPAKIETIASRRFGESDLRGALDNPDKNTQPVSPAPATEEKKPENPEDESDEGAQAPEKADPQDKEGKDDKPAEAAEQPADYQLLRALDLLNGLSLYNAGKGLETEKATP